MINVQAAWLQSLKDLKDVPMEQLEWFIACSSQENYPAGDFLLKPDDKIDSTRIILSGRIRLYRIQNGDMMELLVQEPGDITGFLPFSRGNISILYAQAVTDTEILSFPVSAMDEMIRTKFELTQSLVHVMTSRVRDATSFQQQNDKMLALGKLSAGLAHELNNPAAALVRGATTLIQHLKMSPVRLKTMLHLQLSSTDFDLITSSLSSLLEKSHSGKQTLVQRSQSEEELEHWLQISGITNPGELSEDLVDSGIGISDLKPLAAALQRDSLSPVLNWISNMLVTDKMVSDMQEASIRIGDLVHSVKIFTHMDQGHDRQLTDLHSGIQNTLAMLDYRFRKGNVKLLRNYDASMPPVMAMVGELNQVWTNIIDNALDAMEGQPDGAFEIQTSHDGDFAEIRMTDNGPGIPENIIRNIFDPFFTTKDIGRGTGLGLDVVTRIIRQHRGSIKVDSKPGHTVFTICLPLNLLKIQQA